MATDKKNTQAAPTVANQIWDDIKDREVAMFAIPNQFVHQYCEPAPLDPSRCFLKLLSKASSFIPAIEEAIGANKKLSKYNLEVQGDYIIVSRNNVVGQ